MKPSIKEFTKIDGNATSYSLHGIKANARIQVEQDADLVWKNLKLKKLGQPHDDVLLTTERRFKHYKANEDRIILKDGLLFRKYYGETGSVEYYQLLIPYQLVNEVVRSLHGDFGKHWYYSLVLVWSTPPQSTLKQMGYLSDLTRQSDIHWRLKQANGDHYGINTSALRSLITTSLITRVLAVNQAECFMDAFVILSLI